MNQPTDNEREYCSLFGEHRDNPCPCGWPNRRSDLEHAERIRLRAELAAANESLVGMLTKYDRLKKDLHAARTALAKSDDELSKLKAELAQYEADEYPGSEPGRPGGGR